MKTILRLGFLPLLLILMQSCKKEIVRREYSKELTIDTTIAAGSHYYLDLAPYGDEGDYVRVQEAGKYFSISRLEDESDMFTYIYHYVPADIASSTKDHVTLSIKRYESQQDSTQIHINFTIQ